MVRDLADGLLATGNRPSLITSHPGRPRRSLEDGLRILRLPRPPHGPLLRRLFEPYVSHVPLTYAALRAGDYDLAHAMHAPDALAAARWQRHTGRPSVLTYLGIPDPDWLAQHHRLNVLRAAIRGCAAVVTLSRFAAAQLERSLGATPRVITPGVDLTAFAPGPTRTPVPTIVCSADAGDPRKHVALLVKAFALVRRECPDARLILSRPREPGTARIAGVPDRAPGLEWHDLDDRATLAHANARAWVAALPAPAEAFGLVLLEALACGTPVVGYDDGGIPEIVDRPGIGGRFARLDAGVLASCLLEALELTARPETSVRCRARAEEFSTERSTGAYLALYRELGVS